MNSKDNFEIEFAPSDWGVKLADEMRRDASKGAHPAEAAAAETLPESIRLSPFYGLDEQAKLLRPGNELEDIRAWNQLSLKFRTEYGGMRALILKVNEAVKEKTESLRLKVALELCALYKLILDDGIAQPAGNTPAPAAEQKTDDDFQKEENDFMMNEAAIYDDEVSGDDEIFLEMPGNGQPRGRTDDVGFTSLIKNWAADSTLLVTTVFAHKAAAQTIQEKYFEGHPILFEDVEARLNETIQAMEDASTTFNEYLKIRGANIQAESGRQVPESMGAGGSGGTQQDHLTLDIQAIRAGVGRNLVDPLVYEWEEFAKNKALTEIRKESEEFKAQMPGSVARQSQKCEIPITVQGSRNTRIPQPFLEETYTAVVFANGAVLRLLEVVTHGQIIIIQNVRLKQEAACRVVSFKPSASVEGNAEVEFIQPAPGFWGIDFPAENENSRSEAVPGAPPPSPPPQVRHAEPKVGALPESTRPPIEQKKVPALFVKEIIPLERKAEIKAPPPVEVQPAAPPVIEETRTKPSNLMPQIEVPSTSPAPRPAEDSFALNSAIVSAYAMPGPVAPASRIGPTIAKVAAAKDEGTNKSKSHIAERLRELARESAPVPKVADKTDALIEKNAAHPIETATKDSPRQEPAFEMDYSEASFDEPIASTELSSAKRLKIYGAVAAMGLAVAIGVGAYVWNLRWKAAISMPHANAAAFKAPSASEAQFSAGLSAGINTKMTPGASAAPNTTGKEKRSASEESTAKNAPPDKVAQDTTNAAARQASTLPFQIAAPVTHPANGLNSQSDTTITTPEITSQPLPNGVRDPNALLGSIVSSSSAPAPPRAPGPVTSERNFVEPRVLSMFPVMYPKMAIDHREEGDVMVTAMVNATGKVMGTKAISGPMTLRQAAANAVSMWKFEPGMLNGKPADSLVTVKVTFKLPH